MSDVVLDAVVDGRCVPTSHCNGMSSDDEMRHQLASFGDN